jgi:hypothetical protein
MTAYAVSYRSTGPRGERIRSLSVDASDESAAREAARLRLALPTLVAARVEFLAIVQVVGEREPMR